MKEKWVFEGELWMYSSLIILILAVFGSLLNFNLQLLWGSIYNDILVREVMIYHSYKSLVPRCCYSAPVVITHPWLLLPISDGPLDFCQYVLGRLSKFYCLYLSPPLVLDYTLQFRLSLYLPCHLLKQSLLYDVSVYLERPNSMQDLVVSTEPLGTLCVFCPRTDRSRLFCLVLQSGTRTGNTCSR